MRLSAVTLMLLVTSIASATPPGFVKSTIPFGGAMAGVAYDPTGTLYALEGAAFGQHTATLHTILPNGEPGVSYSVVGESLDNFFVGGIAFDAIGNRVLITDNTFISSADPGRMYAVSTLGVQQTVASGIPKIAGVAVRGSGEMFVSTAVGSGGGAVLQVDRTTGSTSNVLAGLDYGAGLAFDGAGSLIVQNADSSFAGSLQKIPMTPNGNGLSFGSPEPLLGGMNSSAGVVAVGNDFYTTGSGGLYHVAGNPLAETFFDSNGEPFPFATGLAFYPGSHPFGMFAGPSGGRLATIANYDDTFVTILTPAEPGDYNGDGAFTHADYDVWRTAYDTNSLYADGNLDGTVDTADYVLWRKHFVPANTGSGVTVAANVPEPAAAALMLAVFVGWPVRCRSRRLLPTRAAALRAKASRQGLG